ncbi:hypothetical protein RI065_00745 [Mycoplasmatota bacterium zrk1]
MRGLSNTQFIELFFDKYYKMKSRFSDGKVIVPSDSYDTFFANDILDEYSEKYFNKAIIGYRDLSRAVDVSKVSKGYSDLWEMVYLKINSSQVAKEEGTFSERRSLLILLRKVIADIEDIITIVELIVNIISFSEVSEGKLFITEVKELLSKLCEPKYLIKAELLEGNYIHYIIE